MIRVFLFPGFFLALFPFSTLPLHKSNLLQPIMILQKTISRSISEVNSYELTFPAYPTPNFPGSSTWSVEMEA